MATPSSTEENVPSTKIRRLLVTLIKCAISIAILWWLFSRAVQENQFQQIFRSNPNWLGLASAAAFCLLAFLISFYRWMLFVRAIDLPFGFADAVRIGFIGLFFNLFAFGVIGGDALRAFYITRQVRHRVTDAIASVFFDRFIGLLTMCGVAAIAFLFLTPSQADDGMHILGVVKTFAWVGTIGGLGVLLVAIAAPRLATSSGIRRLVEVPVIGDVVDQLINVVLVYRSKPGLIGRGLLLSGAVNVCFLLTIYLIASSLTADHPGFAEHFLIEPIAMVANAAPLPGGIGGMEYVLSFMYGQFQNEGGQNFGIVVAFGFRAILLLISACGAVVWFLNRQEFRAGTTWEGKAVRDASTGDAAA